MNPTICRLLQLVISSLLYFVAASDSAALYSYAVCLTGGKTHLLLDSSFLANLKENLINSLPNSHTVTVFAVFSIEEQYRSEALKESLSTLGIVHVAWHFTPHYSGACNNVSKFASSFVSQWTKIQSCYNSIASYENVHDISFDYIVRIRPDLFFFQPVSNWLIIPSEHVQVGECLYFPSKLSCTHYLAANDHFAVIPRKFGDVYSSIADFFLADCRDTDPVQLMSEIRQTACHSCVDTRNIHVAPECILSYYLLKKDALYYGLRSTFGLPERINSATLLTHLWTVTRIDSNGSLCDRFCSHSINALKLLPVSLADRNEVMAAALNPSNPK
jgi:hypothetical protein